MKPCNLKLTAPSTSANLGPGFDCLGLALEQRNSWTVTVCEGSHPGRCRLVESSGGGANEVIPEDERHLFFSSWKKLQELGFGPDLFDLLRQSGLEVQLRAANATPIARGLGSSAAVRVASAEVYRRLTGRTERPAWELGAQLEGHPDNAGPAGLGGLVLGTLDQETNRYRALQPEIHSCWQLAVAIPNFSLHTAQARAVLPQQLSRGDGIFNMGRLAFLLQGLQTGDSDFLKLGCQDRWHQHQRASLIPGFQDVLDASLVAGGAAAFLSGAGPTMACFVDRRQGTGLASEVAKAMEQAFLSHSVQADVLVLEVDKSGLLVTEFEGSLA